MGVLYDVLFKPIRRDGVSTSAATDDVANQTPPEWVLDRRDGGSLVWRRDVGPSSRDARKRVEFLDAVQVRVFERDECGGDDVRDRENAKDDDDDDDDDDNDNDEDCWTGGDGFGSAAGEAWADKDDYAVLVVISVTVVGLCIGLAYLFAPVRWLLHHVLLDDD